MFERFTDRARRVLDLAQEEARMLSHGYIGTEHLLLGLIREGDGVAAQVLDSLRIDLESVRGQVEEIASRGRPVEEIAHRGRQAPARVPFAPRAKQVLGLARREALALGHSYIGTEHILLGLIREGEGVAAQALAGLGADLNGVRQRVIQVLHDAHGADQPMTGHAGRGGGRPGGEPGPISEILEWADSIDAQLSALGRRLGAGPQVSDLDQRIAQARRGKEAAAADEDYENAAALRDAQRQLLADKAARQQEWASAHLDLAALTAELHQLGEQVGRIRELIREHGTGPQDGAA